ncbi:MAG: hypothetical protein H0U52_00875 [Chloroflexi bacterium]|nr:hypothetical protein [Chloroflexota bacterium]
MIKINRARRRRVAHPRWLAIAAVTALTGLALPPAILAHGPDPVLAGEALYPLSKELTFRWLTGAIPPAAMRTAIVAAAADAGESRLSRAPIFTYDASGVSFVQYGGNVVCGVNGIACMRRDEPGSFRMYFREQGHVFDWGTMKWCQMYATAPNGCYDAENVALDEFGHVQILGHHVNDPDDGDYTDAVVQTYSRTKPSEGWNAHVLGRCDVATLQREYGLLAATTKVSTCLNLSSSLTIKSSVTAGRFDQPVTLTATLEISDFDAYERLGGQNLSGRVVRLERKTPTGSWSSLGSMSAGSSAGTYVYATTIRYTADYRAVFATPYAEGLRADTSAVVRVTLGTCTGICPSSVLTGPNGGPQ